MASTTTLKEIASSRSRWQKPTTQVGSPDERALDPLGGAQQGQRLHRARPTSRLKRNIEIYYEEAEKNGWPTG